jgi:hypothetical protein
MELQDTMPACPNCTAKPQPQKKGSILSGLIAIIIVIAFITGIRFLVHLAFRR